jgi:ABC-2 type transport system ATP-binding protein
MSILCLHNVHKSFAKKHVFNGINLSIEKGTVLGLLGANGAGKTTLIKTALGLLKAEQGEATLFGEPSWDLSPHNKQRLGYVSQKMDCFQWMTAEQLLDYVAAFYLNWDPSKVARLMFDWDMSSKAKISSMSEGQRQRLSIILAIGHSPELVIFDEPVASLDPSARRLFIKQLIDMNADQETTIVFSTHITSDIERVAADVAFLQDGKVSYHGGIDELKEQVVRLHVQGNADLQPLVDNNKVLNQQFSGKQGRITVKGFDEAQLAQWQQQLKATIKVETLSLEDIFLELNSCKLI